MTKNRPAMINPPLIPMAEAKATRDIDNPAFAKKLSINTISIVKNKAANGRRTLSEKLSSELIEYELRLIDRNTNIGTIKNPRFTPAGESQVSPRIWAAA